MGEGIRSKTECTCSQEKEGKEHTNPYCPYYKRDNDIKFGEKFIPLEQISYTECKHEYKLIGIHDYGEISECIICGVKSMYCNSKNYRKATEEEFINIFTEGSNDINR